MGQEASSIVVPKQRTYTGRNPVIPSRLADTPCTTLGVQGLLDPLNTTLGTSYSLDDPFFSYLLEYYIPDDCDFGLAYSYLRQIWYTDDWKSVIHLIDLCSDEDQEKRRKALVGNQIVNSSLPPRRVWDLYSNRVVPYWTMVTRRVWPQPISHAWVEEKDRTAVWTPINNYEWPVPIPKDANLDLIRIEMLNLGVEYAWLDVLCLRQVGGRREDLRVEEWKVDVPTIGRVYNPGAQYVYFSVMYYLSGLGRPLTLKEGDLESDRSWFRRAWTLQEVGESRVGADREIAGDTSSGPLHAKCKDGEFHKQLQDTRDLSWLHQQLGEMQNRVSTNPVDKIAGLAFLVQSHPIPAYSESASLEEAWTALVYSMNVGPRAQLFVLCAEPGDGGPKWRPSWHQVMTKPLLPYAVMGQYVHRDARDEDWCNESCIEGFVRGLAVVEGGDRDGEFIVERDDGVKRFKITAAHTYPIPEDAYTLIYFSCLDPDNLNYPDGVPNASSSSHTFQRILAVRQCKLWHDSHVYITVTHLPRHYYVVDFFGIVPGDSNWANFRVILAASSTHERFTSHP
ncbi:hypothetical protein IW261DRAFT_1423878 [Armillaria novae-zelandiae]|uniref:Heterokaryon incompatibility domain-containing protein n=1 Tax=Armillaria novae-zelandiae TaxID=153914 RepID=A0AA39NWC8_9AGAR|nr:hypothetical protein IW261DRAFT_1423878 [Armillaria novae-zelandiae]